MKGETSPPEAGLIARMGRTAELFLRIHETACGFDGKKTTMRYREFFLRSTTALAVACLPAGCASDQAVIDDYGQRCAVPLGSAPQRGPAGASVTIVEFADFQCSFCRYEQATIAEVDQLRPGLRWSFRHFPIASIHPNATSAASAADCANEQGAFWPMHDALFAKEGASLSGAVLSASAEQVGLDMDTWHACLNSESSLARVDADLQLGIQHGVGGTPTFIINGYTLPGAYPTRDFLSVIDLAEEEARASNVQKSDYYQTLVEDGCGE